MLKKSYIWIAFAASFVLVLVIVAVVGLFVFLPTSLEKQLTEYDEESRTVNKITLNVVECSTSDPQGEICEPLTSSDDYLFSFGRPQGAPELLLNEAGLVTLEPQNQESIHVHTPANVAGIDILPSDCRDCVVEDDMDFSGVSSARALEWRIRRRGLPSEVTLRVWMSPLEERQSATITFNYHLCWGVTSDENWQPGCEDGPRYRSGLYRNKLTPCVSVSCEFAHRMPTKDYPEMGTRETYSNLELGEYQFETQLLRFVEPPSANDIIVVPYGDPIEPGQSLSRPSREDSYVINVAVTPEEPKPVYDVYVFFENEESSRVHPLVQNPQAAAWPPHRNATATFPQERSQYIG